MSLDNCPCTVHTVLYCTFQVDNDISKWAKLGPTAIVQFKCTKPEGYALAHSKAKNETFLEDKEPEEIKHVISSSKSYGKRRGT